jgi:peptidyl-prolyl cis-trans isomerase SurA
MTQFLQTMVLVLAAAAPQDQVFDRVAAVVNGEVVTLSDLEERVGDMQRAAMAKGLGAAKARTQSLQAAFDQIVAEKLLTAQAAALQLEVTDAQVDGAVEDIKRRNRFNDAQLDEALSSQGFTREAFRKSVKRDLEVFQILNVKVKSRVKITDEDVKSYYQSHPGEFAGEDQVHVRHIFMALSKGATSSEEARVQGEAEKVLQRLRAGEDFAKLARDLSQGPSAADGGDLGWVKRGVVQPELEKAAFALSAGQVSPAIKTRAGFHILRVEERRTGQPRPFDEVKEDIRNRLMSEQIENYRGQYVAELKKDATIDVRIPELTP